jgi:hypothetical protein
MFLEPIYTIQPLSTLEDTPDSNSKIRTASKLLKVIRENIEKRTASKLLKVIRENIGEDIEKRIALILEI